MNPNVAMLHAIAVKPSRVVVGLMSGTSMDGLDVALCRLTGTGLETRVEMLEFATVGYDGSMREEIRKVFAMANADLPHLAMLNGWIGQQHATMVNGRLAAWGMPRTDVDLVASHGQTVMHAPELLHRQVRFGNATLQIGDGDHVAVGTGIVTVSDFRQKHVAAGGQGAPLAVYGDHLIFGDVSEDRILLNMGGIANFTYLPAGFRSDEVFVTDTGPGNTLLDAFTRSRFPGQEFDRDAAIASAGSRHEGLLAALKCDHFFDQPFPRTTGAELFNLEFLRRNQNITGTDDLRTADVLATLTRFSAETIVEAIMACMSERQRTVEAFEVYASGGGCRNPLLMQWIDELLPCRLRLTDDLGVPADAKEAVLFAVLANEAIAGGGCSFGERQGIPSVSLGKVSFPQ